MYSLNEESPRNALADKALLLLPDQIGRKIFKNDDVKPYKASLENKTKLDTTPLEK